MDENQEVFDKLQRLGFKYKFESVTHINKIEPLTILKMYEFLCKIFLSSLGWDVTSVDLRNTKRLATALRAMDLYHCISHLKKKDFFAKNKSKLLKPLSEILSKLELKYGLDVLYNPSKLAEHKKKIETELEFISINEESKLTVPLNNSYDYTNSNSMISGKQLPRTPVKPSPSTKPICANINLNDNLERSIQKNSSISKSSNLEIRRVRDSGIHYGNIYDTKTNVPSKNFDLQKFAVTPTSTNVTSHNLDILSEKENIHPIQPKMSYFGKSFQKANCSKETNPNLRLKTRHLQNLKNIWNLLKILYTI